MIKALKNILYSFLSTKKCRSLFILCFALFLGGCENDGDTSLGEEGNYKLQAACWQTSITQAVTERINELYSTGKSIVGGNGPTSGGGAAFICIAFAVWMALKLLKVLGSFKEESIGEVWTEIGHKLFLCAACAIVLLNSYNINEAINAFIVPIYKTVLELGIKILGSDTSVDFNLGSFGTVYFDANTGVCFDPSHFSATDFKTGIDPLSGCLICRISNRLNAGIKIGISLIVSLRIGAILVGLTMILLFTAAKLVFVLFVVDSLFRLNFAAFLIPLLIMGIPFNWSRKWSKHGFLMFINSSGIMLFLGFLVALATGGIERIMNNLSPNIQSNPEAAFEGLGSPLLSMFLIATLLVNIPALAVALADKFIGGGNGLEFQKMVSKFVMNTVKKFAAAALASVSGGATKTFTNVAEKYETTREISDNIRQKKNATNSILNSLAGTNDDD